MYNIHCDIHPKTSRKNTKECFKKSKTFSVNKFKKRTTLETLFIHFLNEMFSFFILKKTFVDFKFFYFLNWFNNTYRIRLPKK